ncbi:MAG TPA: FAD-binding oxidoreductase [Burkholderiaceae bacterium]
MKRWNGWGDEAVAYELSDSALAFLAGRIGPGAGPLDATLQHACAGIPASRLPAHPLIETAPAARLAAGIGQSLQDWLRLRYGQPGALPDGVAFPENEDEVRMLLDFAAACDAHVIACGGGTSVAGHLTALGKGKPVLTINTTRLARLLDLDREAQLATFGAGVFGPDLEAQLRAQGYTLGHFPQSFEYSTLGGWITTRSSGQQSLRYGRIEQLFAGGRMETPAGRFELPTFPASAAGTDLRELALGSEGRMGILTRATVRVTRAPEREAFHAVFFPDWEQARICARELVQNKVPLSMLRVSNVTETQTTLALAGHARLLGMLQRYLRWRGAGDNKCLMLLGASGSAATVDAAIAQALALARRHHGVHAGRTIGEKWKQNRFRNVYLRNSAWRQGYAIDTFETAVDWPRVTAMMQAMERGAHDALAAFSERAHVYTHLSHLYGQGASVYTTCVYRLAGAFEPDLARWRALKQAVSRAIVATGGTISHQHGVGLDHAPYLEQEKGALGMDAMRALFARFDPDGRMNPGKLLPESAHVG